MSQKQTFDVKRADAPRGSVFVLTTTFRGSSPQHQHIQAVWAAAWKSGGAEHVPPLLIIEPGMTLTPLGAAELRDGGIEIIDVPQETEA